MVTEERVVNLETTLASFIAQSNRIIAAIHEDVAEIRVSNARTDRQLLELQQQAEKDRKDFNNRLAQISDSMGTLVEDFVARCGFQLAKAVFQGEEAQTCTIRVRRRHPSRSGEMMELDLLAIGPTKALVVEAKRRLDTSQIREFREKMASLLEFFPELAGKVVSAAVASVYLDHSVIALLNRQKIYGIAMGDEVMEVVNLGQF